MHWKYFKPDESLNASLEMLKELWLMSSNTIQFVLQSRCHNLFCIVARHLTLASCQPAPLPVAHPSHDWANYFCVIYSSLLCIYPTKLSSSFVRAAWLGLAWPWYCAASYTETSLVLPAATSQSRLPTSHRPPSVPSPGISSKLLISQETLVALRECILQQG